MNRSLVDRSAGFIRPNGVQAGVTDHQVGRYMTESPPGMIGRYQIIRQLASGSQGTVYQAYDPDLGREIALKVLHPYLATSEVIARFQREARIVASINHPNIAGITDVGEYNGSHFLAIEYVPHTTREFIDRGPMDITQAVTIAYQTALALEAARISSRGITHHDIKPDNLLLTSLGPGGMVKLIDFGIAHAADMAPMTQAGSQWGTPYYMPPEQWMGERGDTRSDVYSLGMVMYQMLCGHVPFDSTASNSLARQTDIARQHIEVDPASLRSVRHDIPESVEAIVAKCVAKSPGYRYQTPGELANALAGVLGLATVPSASQPAPRFRSPVGAPGGQRPSQRDRRPIIAVGSFGVMIAIVSLMILASQPSGCGSRPALSPAALPAAPAVVIAVVIDAPMPAPVPTITGVGIRTFHPQLTGVGKYVQTRLESQSTDPLSLRERAGVRVTSPSNNLGQVRCTRSDRSGRPGCLT